MKHKTRTKALSWLLSLALIVGLLPGMSLTAQAAGDGSSANPIEIGTWAEMQQSMAGQKPSGETATQPTYYLLTADITASDSDTPIEVAAGRNVVLALNGKTIDRGLAEKSGLSNGYVISVSGTLTITGDGTITGGNVNEDGEEGSGVIVNSGATFNMEGGSISVNKASYNGAGVFVYGGKMPEFGDPIPGGTFNMSGGTISNNSAGRYYNGGGVLVACGNDEDYDDVLQGGTFNMTGGTISGNMANNGGGVYIDNYYTPGGTFTMSGGKISGNTATSDGGGVCSGGTFTMTGGVIGGSGEGEGNTAGSGGGVKCSNGTFTMSGGSKISGNTARHGGGVSCSDTTFTMEDATIGGSGEGEGNTAIISGGGASISNGEFTMTDSSKIIGNTANEGGGLYVALTLTMEHGTVSGNTAPKGAGAFVKINDDLTLAGGEIVENNGSGVYVDGSGDLFLTGGRIADNTGYGVENHHNFSLMGGTVDISGNGLGDVLLTGNFPVININGAFTLSDPNDPISVSFDPALTNSRNITSGYNNYMSGKDPANYFTSGQAGCDVTLSGAGGEAVLHYHPFEYTASGATITAKCGETDCPKGYDKTPATLTVKAPEDLVEDGLPKNATVECGIPGVNAERLTITYEKDGETLDAAPTTAGTFTASVTLDSSITGGASVTASVEFTVREKEPVAYIDADGSTKQTGTDYTYVRESIKSWGDESAAKWYVVDKDVTIDERITVTGDVRLLLCDGATLTASKGITVTGANNSLTIYGQSGDAGALIANGAGNQAGIGGTQGVAGGTVTINGGNITATSAYGGAGIGGGGDGGAGGNTTINGGIVNAQGGNGAGIGGGYSGGTGTTIINGGTVTAVGHESPGIGFGEMYMNSYDPLGLTVAEGMTIVAGGGTSDAKEKASASDLNEWSRYIYIEKDEPLTEVTYLDEKGEEKTLGAGTPDNPGYTRVRPYTTTWGKESEDFDNPITTWYVVDKDVTITDQIVVKGFNGNINLILTDGATLTASKGITFEGFLNKFTVYGQSAGTGKLTSGEPVLGRSGDAVMTFNGGVIDISVGKDAENKFEASIGAGKIIVNGGSVSGSNANGYRGIQTRSVTINGGTVNAISNVYGSQAIGVDSSSITVNGGVLNTYGSYRAIDCSDGDVTVNGGSLTARSETYAIYANLTVTGGTVLAEGMKGSYNVGDGVYGNVTVSGGSVTVIGGDGGNGQNGKAISGSVTINNGLQVKAGDAETDTFVTDYVENHNHYRWAMIAKFHTHTLKDYQLTTTNAKDDTITAKCTDDLDNCTLASPDYQAKLVILAPTEGGGAATLTGATDFGVTAEDVEYYKGDDKLNAAPTEDGFFKAQITVGGKTAYVTYGVNEIIKDTAFNASTAHGNFTVPAVATAYATVTIATTPETGYELKAITVKKADNSVVTSAVDGNNGTFTMPEESVTVSAEFKLHDYTITKSAMTNGSVTVAATAKMGDTVNVIVNPDTGYELDTLKYDTTDITATNGVYSFTMPADDVTITATFKKYNSAITADTIENGSITVKKDGANVTQAQYEDTITLSNTPNAGYEFVSYTVTKTGDSTKTVTVAADGTFTMPEYPVTVAATFAKRDVGVKLETKNGNETCAATLLTDSCDAAPDNFSRKVDQTFVLSVATGEDYTFVVSGSTPIEFRQLTESEKDTFIEKYPECDANTQLFMVTMPAVATGDLTVTVEFKEIKVYTVLYQPTDQTTTGVWCKIGDDTKSIEMQMSPDASMGDKKVFALNVSMADAPAKVAFATSNAFGGVTMANANLRESVQAAATWTNGFNGQYLVIGGYVKTVIAAFTPNNSALAESDKNLTAMPAGTTYQIAVCGTDENGVVTTPGKVNAPAKPERTGYVFEGWSGFEGAAPNVIEKLYSENAEISLYDDAILSAAWHPETFKVTVNLNGGEGQGDIDNVTYQQILNTLTDPTKTNFVFDGWRVAENVVENGTFYAEGSQFDTKTPITSDLELEAQWKHVHSYTRVPLNYEGFNGALDKYSKYFPYLHVSFCSCFDVELEPHTFRNGSCVDCGYTDPRSTTATLYVSYWKDDAEWMTEDPRTEKIGGEVTVDAFWQIGQYRFSKWQYRTPSETTWHDLSADTMVGFIFPCALYVRALYVDTVTQPQVSLSARRYVTQAEGYNWDSVLFQMEYKLPSNCTYIDSGIRMGDNQGISFYKMKKRQTNIIVSMVNGITDFIFSDPLSYTIDKLTEEEKPPEYVIEKREDSVLKTMNAETLAEYMMENKPINIPEYEPIYWQASPTSKGRFGSVNTLTPLRFIQMNNGKHYIYGVGWLRYKDKDGNIRTINTPALATTRDSVPGDTVTKTGQN
ncbi:MAG: InlB B-repeat-containing protein [Oscillospiraceae bacterium]|nr:InlB B-repeat-containing protein [Oscillospiraceae bacterium]